MGPVNNKQLDQ